jgi:hypothetical protein
MNSQCIKVTILFITFSLCYLSVNAQRILQYDLKSTFVLGTGNSTAFWGVSNQYGTVSTRPYSGSLQTKLFSEFDSTRTKKIDYAFGIDLLNRVDNSYKLFFHQYYLKIKYKSVTLQAGRMEEYIGNQDSILSSGGLLWSNNAPPMPKVTIGILRYTAIPYTKGFLEIKGAISHGWFNNDAYVKHVWLHHKYIYIRAGGNLPVKAHFGFQHFAQWGGVLPDGYKLPSSLHDFKTIFFVNQYDSAQIPAGTPIPGEYSNRIGNHLGSRNIGLDIDLRPVSMNFYYQSIFEDASGLKWLNKRDGLWGVSLTFKKINWLSGLVYEFVNTTDQSMTFGEDKNHNEPDNYFNHGIYLNGWTYNNFTIGTPLITSPVLQPSLGLPNDITQIDYLRNNKVIAHHLGLRGSLYQTNYRLFVTYTQNKGTFHVPFDYTKESVSTYIELKRQIKKFLNMEVSIAVATDFGQMYTSKSSFLFTLRKNGKLF